jgi:glutathione synthase/RimK-type ligase-like ATP-grasp enzyme
MILILTFEEDPHGNQLVEALREQGCHDFLRLDMGRAFDRNTVDIRFEGGHWRCRVDFREDSRLVFDNESPPTVMLRRYLHPSFHRRVHYPSPADIDVSQTYFALNWWLHSLPGDCFPLGSLQAAMAGENKFRQLKEAAAVGLPVQSTLFSTRPSVLEAFAREHGEVVVKTLGSQSSFTEGEGGDDTMHIFGAARLDAATLAGRLADYQHTQLYLQKAVPKVAEWRITALPGEFIACRIDTSAIPDGTVDYRPHIGRLTHEIRPLPAGLETKLRAYLERMGLATGCFDFAEMPDGSMVFFECNPIGEWLWIERLTGYPISRSIARILMEHHQVRQDLGHPG